MIFRHLLNMRSHPTWVRGLKLRSKKADFHIFASHPTWVRGLKPKCDYRDSVPRMSHPTWVRGLKLLLPCFIQTKVSRTLRGCVD